uniref:Uncharacterized protein n=1 Tax=Romanomermis culicivorax TaxID=13658 RepID=A0A915KHC0_ROMCU
MPVRLVYKALTEDPVGRGKLVGPVHRVKLGREESKDRPEARVDVDSLGKVVRREKTECIAHVQNDRIGEDYLDINMILCNFRLSQNIFE